MDPQQHAAVCCAALAAARHLLLLASSPRGDGRLSTATAAAMWVDTLRVLHVAAPQLRHMPCQVAAYGVLDVLKEGVLAGLTLQQCSVLLEVVARACKV